MSRLGIRSVLVLALFIMSQAPLARAENDISVSANAFGSMYYGQTFNAGLRPTGFSDTKANFTNFSLLGADATAKLGDSFTAATEVVAQGNPTATSTYSVYMQWGYVSYAAPEGTIFRIGRQRYPLWTASEFINNHHELPYRVMPNTVYQNAPFSSYDGASISHSFDVSGAKLGFSLFGGSPVLDIPVSPAFTSSFSNLYGIRVGLEGEGWRVRAVASSFTGDVTLTGLGSQGGHEQSYSVGYRFDKYNIVSWAEYAYFTSPDGSRTYTGQKFNERVNTGYILGGYRLGAFLPRYTFAQASARSGFTPFPATKTTTHTLGLNYDVNKKVTIKGEYQIDLIPFAQDQTLALTSNPGSSRTVANSVYFGIDFEI